MELKLNAASRKTVLGIAELAVLCIALAISAYSFYFVTRHLGVPRIFAAPFSAAFDGVAIVAAGRALMQAQEGRSAAGARLTMVAFVGLSAWINSLHAILGAESPLAIPIWAGLPVGAAVAFELHSSQARARALAKQGHRYPAPMPKYGGIRWTLFPLDTLDKYRDVAWARGEALAQTQGWEPKQVRKARRLALETTRMQALEATPEPERTTERPERTAGKHERNERPERTEERTAGRDRNERTERKAAGARNGTNVVPLQGRAAHARHKHIREWAWAEGHLPRTKVRGALPAWIIELYERTEGTAGTNEREERTEAES